MSGLITRRGFFFGAAATLAVIRTPGLLMPVKAEKIILPEKKIISGRRPNITTSIEWGGKLIHQHFAIQDGPFQKEIYIPLTKAEFYAEFPDFGMRKIPILKYPTA